MGFLSILWEYKSLIAIGLLSLALASMYAYTGIVKKDRDAAVSLSNSLKGELKISQASVKTLEISIKDQNTKIELFEADAEKRLSGNQENLDKANTTASVIKKQADDLLKRQPIKETTSCANANELINGEVRDANK